MYSGKLSFCCLFWNLQPAQFLCEAINLTCLFDPCLSSFLSQTHVCGPHIPKAHGKTTTESVFLSAWEHTWDDGSSCRLASSRCDVSAGGETRERGLFLIPPLEIWERKLTAETAMMNSLLKRWSTSLLLFFPPTSAWWIGSWLASVNDISFRPSTLPQLVRKQTCVYKAPTALQTHRKEYF